MKCFFDVNKTTEEKLAVTNRFITLMLIFIGIVIVILIYDLISIATGYRESVGHWGQMCSTLGIIVCCLSLNIKRKKEYMAELEQNEEW